MPGARPPRKADDEEPVAEEGGDDEWDADDDDEDKPAAAPRPVSASTSTKEPSKPTKPLESLTRDRPKSAARRLPSRFNKYVEFYAFYV